MRPILGGAARWQLISERGSPRQATPNYYGVGGELQLGYSVHQMFDLAGFANYTPMSLKNTEVGRMTLPFLPMVVK